MHPERTGALHLCKGEARSLARSFLLSACPPLVRPLSLNSVIVKCERGGRKVHLSLSTSFSLSRSLQVATLLFERAMDSQGAEERLILEGPDEVFIVGG